MKILIAQKAKNELAQISNDLINLGQQVTAVFSIDEALEHAKKEQLDLIMLDTNLMKESNLSSFRAIQNGHWVPIILLCNEINTENNEKALALGFDDLIAIPFEDITLTKLLKLMQHITDLKEAHYSSKKEKHTSAHKDSLTGLHSRLKYDVCINDLLDEVDRYHAATALFVVDVDNYHNVNDVHGHQMGDLLIIEMANRLKSCLRTDDFLARLESNQFLIVLNLINNHQEAETVAKQLLVTITHDYNLQAQQVRAVVNIGICCYPDEHSNREELLPHAVIAMRHAKSLGRNNFEKFTVDLKAKYKSRAHLENALKFALEKNEFYLNYQPLFDLKTGSLVGLEALLGWNHPKFGQVSPEQFVPIAEETGLISHIGNWVLEMACQQAMNWPLDKFKDFKFAVNVSSYQFKHENFFQHLVDILYDTHLSPYLLELEITETTVMSYDSDIFKNTMKKISDLGIAIAIDDFGTGYSSLLRLRRLPISALKIDKSFIQEVGINTNSATIINCLIELGQKIGINIIAEGIETEEQLNFLLKNNCPQGQGFILSKPLSAEQIPTFLESQLKQKIKK